MRRLVVLLLTPLLAGCVAPPRGDHDFQLKAAHSAKAVASSVAVARMTADGVARGRIPAPYADVVLTAAEKDASSVQGTFESYQPPAGSDQLRAQLDDLLARAVQGIAGLRIAVRRGEADRLGELSQQLAPVAQALQQAQATPP